MPIIVRETKTTLPPMAEGIHICRCYGIVDIGEQYSEKYGKYARKGVILWEVSDERYTDRDGVDRPRTISREYALSLNEKSGLRKMLEQWRSKKFTAEELDGFDLQRLLGLACQIQIVNTERNGNLYPDMTGILAVPKGTEVPAQENENIYFDWDGKSAAELTEAMAVLPEWIQKKIRDSRSFAELESSPEVDGFMPAEEDDLPF